MDRRDLAAHRKVLPDLGRRQNGLGSDKGGEFVPILRSDPGLAAGVAMPTAQIFGRAPLILKATVERDS